MLAPQNSTELPESLKSIDYWSIAQLPSIFRLLANSFEGVIRDSFPKIKNIEYLTECLAPAPDIQKDLASILAIGRQESIWRECKNLAPKYGYSEDFTCTSWQDLVNSRIYRTEETSKDKIISVILAEDASSGRIIDEILLRYTTLRSGEIILKSFAEPLGGDNSKSKNSSSIKSPQKENDPVRMEFIDVAMERLAKRGVYWAYNRTLPEVVAGAIEPDIINKEILINTRTQLESLFFGTRLPKLEFVQSFLDTVLVHRWSQDEALSVVASDCVLEDVEDLPEDIRQQTRRFISNDAAVEHKNKFYTINNKILDLLNLAHQIYQNPDNNTESPMLILKIARIRGGQNRDFLSRCAHSVSTEQIRLLDEGNPVISTENFKILAQAVGIDISKSEGIELISHYNKLHTKWIKQKLSESSS
jgi:hypothetical protein